ncbi:hypothetical protein BOTU111921_24190 [Bordetella tumbae]|uniref:hypothetical protein n=1 Tax=Bordetella tumbae TaxID=1649139 RepID=UPI0039EFAB22
MSNVSTHSDTLGQACLSSNQIISESKTQSPPLVVRGNNGLRNEKRWGGVKNYFKNLDQFKAAGAIRNGLTTIDIGPTFIDIYAELKPGKPLYVYFNGAQRRWEKNIKLPIFSGNSVHPSDECSRLSISDPALHLDKYITLAWYVGSTGFATQKVIIPEILDKIISLSNASTVVFVGGSGGGFASLYFSRFYPKSIAVVCNPQTHILKYKERQVRKFLQVCYGVDYIYLAEKDPKLTLGITKSLCRLYNPRRGELTNRIIYMQNISDDFHYTGHYVKFVEALGLDVVENVGFHQQGNFLTLIGDWGDGHIPAPGHVWRGILKNIFLYEKDLDALIVNNQARKLINDDAFVKESPPENSISAPLLSEKD